MQTLITAVIVLASASYAAWALMPAAWRQALARHLGRTPPPATGCGGCGGCGDAAPRAAVQPITVHRRNPVQG